MIALGVCSMQPAVYPGCQRLFSRSYLSHITRFLRLFYFRRLFPAFGRRFSRKRAARDPGYVRY